MPYYMRSSVVQDLLDALVRSSGILRDSVIGKRIEDVQAVIDKTSVLFEQEPDTDPATVPLPFPTAEYLSRRETPDELTAEQVRGLMVNPLNLGLLPGTTPISTSEEWVRRVAVLMRDEGIEQTLVNMLTMMAQTVMDGSEDKPNDTSNR